MLTIVLVVSVVALATIAPALGSRQVSEAGRLLQAAVVGARDQAIHDGRPAGFRLLPDSAWPITYNPAGGLDTSVPLAYSRILPIAPAPEYVDGRVSVYPRQDYSAITRLPAIILEQAVTDGTKLDLPNVPTNWYWNIRVGDSVQINGAGPWYTVAGPMFQFNTEGFVNTGSPGSPTGWGAITPISPTGTEWLVLVNGRDDGPMGGGGPPDGWVDSGWDGVDNDGDKVVDNPGEWEHETWLGPVQGFVSARYTIRRQPAPIPGAREIALPSNMVIDAARSKLPVNPLNGTMQIQVSPDGTVLPVLPYGVPSSVGVDSAWLHFALVARSDILAGPAGPVLPPRSPWSVLSLQRTGRLVTAENPDPADPFRWALSGGQ